MRQYLDLLRDVLAAGAWQENRTGIRTLAIPGAMLRFDLLNEGFPAITTRKLAFKAAMGELIGFLRAARKADDFRGLGCKVWDQNANENPQWLANPYRSGTDDLGEIYGVQWRRMLREQLKREPYPPPRLVISERIPEYAKTGLYEPEWLDKVEPDDFRLEGTSTTRL